jgi:hypothetical protein
VVAAPSAQAVLAVGASLVRLVHIRLPEEETLRPVDLERGVDVKVILTTSCIFCIDNH